MNTRIVLIAISLVALPLYSLAETIGGEDLKQLFGEKTVHFSLASGSEVFMTFRLDGTSRLDGAMSDEGQWRVTDNGYCSKWNNIRKGAERCVSVEKNGDNLTLKDSNGSHYATVLDIAEQQKSK